VIIITSAEATPKALKEWLPNCGEKFIFIQATTTNATDYITVTDLTIVHGFYLMSTGGTVAAGTCATTTNVITLSNGATGTKIWSGFAYGV